MDVIQTRVVIPCDTIIMDRQIRGTNRTITNRTTAIDSNSNKDPIRACNIKEVGPEEVRQEATVDASVANEVEAVDSNLDVEDFKDSSSGRNSINRLLMRSNVL